MNTLESSFWRSIANALDKHLPTCHRIRIENLVEPGTPDVNLAYDGRECWIELKVAKGSRVELSPEQVIWLEDRSAAHCNAWVLCLSDKKIIMWPGYMADKVRKNGLAVPAEKEWVKPWDWKDIFKSLLGMV